MSLPAPSTPAEGTEPPAARNFQHYEVLQHPDGSPWELGRGTMGITYKAFDVNLCCEVALKVVSAALLNSANARERFVREARAAAALRHRNVASVYHLGNDGERFFYAMEFIDGETLDALVRRDGPLPVETALRLILQTTRALAAAGRQNLVHRDIKPANIMITHEDADDHMVVKVIDFGLARPVSSDRGEWSSGQLTGGGFVGTPQFASPEQLEEKALDARSDIYSLGVTMWFLLAGRAPFIGSLATICNQHLTKLPPWEQLPDWLPAPVRTLLGHMLEKDPADRPQDAVELRREIEDCLAAVGHGVALPTPSARPPTADVPRRALDTERPPRTGAVLKGRYELVRHVGEGHRGQIYEGRDDGADGQPVTVIFLSAEAFSTPADCERLNDEVRLIQAASHPHLTRICAYERDTVNRAGFLVEEWINGGTLVDLLAARSGALTPAEGLRLLGQAAAAVDHAASRRLEFLDLAIHQARLHFHAPGDVAPREHLSAPMSDWPAWTLKINPLGAIREHAEMNTWAGEVTLLPGLPVAALGSDSDGKQAPAALASTYLRALAALTYELLGGAPGAWRMAAAAGGKYVSLPALTEEGNAVLQRTFGANPGFRRSQDFYETLARAAGFDPVTLQTATVPPRAVPVVPSPPMPVSTAFRARKAQTTGAFFDREPAGFERSLVDVEDFGAGSIADRLTLVDGDAAPVGRWLFGIVAAVVVFVGVVGGVLLMLAQRPVHHPTPPPATATATPAATPRHRPSSSTPRPTVPPPLPKEKETPARTPSPTPPPFAETTPEPTVPPTLPDVVPATPVPIPPPPAPTPEQLVRLFVRTIPNHAEIRSGGKLLGTSPLEVEMRAGTHELIARFDGWPETRETVILAEGQARAVTEIHLMPPGLVPGAELPPTPMQTDRPHRPAPSLRVEPEVRRALPPLTPFNPDGTPEPRNPPDGD